MLLAPVYKSLILSDAQIEERTSMSGVVTVFAVAGVIIFVGFLANIIFRKTGFPDILLLVLAGIILGPVLKIFSAESILPAVPVFASLSLMLILFQGGLSMEIHTILSQSLRAVALGFLHIIFATLVVPVISYFMIGLDWLGGLILGPMTAGTSSVVIVPLMSKIRAPDEIKATLSLESTVTDILNIVLVMMLLQAYLGSPIGFQEVSSSIIAKFAVGITVGAIVGIFWIKMLEIIRKQEYTYMLTLAISILCYATAEYLGGSGPLSTLIFGIFLGNHERMKILGVNIDEKSMRALIENIRRFQSEITFLVRALFFVILGLIYVPEPLGLLYAGVIMTANLFLRYLAIKISTRNSPLYRYRRFMTLMCGSGLANATLSLIVYSEMIAKQVPVAGLYPLIVTNVVMISNVVTTLAPLIARKELQNETRFDLPKNQPKGSNRRRLRPSNSGGL